MQQWVCKNKKATKQDKYVEKLYDKLGSDKMDNEKLAAALSGEVKKWFRQLIQVCHHFIYE